MLKLTFCGGAQSVTGSNYLLEGTSSSGKITRILIDCGLFQGVKDHEKLNYAPFAYNPSNIDALFNTHTHVDHIGRIPRLVKDGFKGKIYSTSPGKELASLMLLDSLGLLEKDTEKDGEELLYQRKDVETAMNHWEAVEYHQGIKVGDFNVILKESGHILGSAMIEVIFEGKKILFTGDLGNPPNPILRDAEGPGSADYMVIESAYGDRRHEYPQDAGLKLERVIEGIAHDKGVLMIPSFSLERTQKLLFDINNLVENERIPQVPIFLDSPLAIKATAVYKKYKSFFNEDAMKIIRGGDDLFNFPGLKMTLSTDESKAINNTPAPKIIIAGSGMSVGGRIVHHERRYLSDPKSVLLLVGYQSAGSLGRRLMEGEKLVHIMGEDVVVRAKVEVITGYSAHADLDELYRTVRLASNTLKKVFVVQGEPKATLFFTQKVKDCMGVDAIAPEIGDSFELV